MNRNQPSMAKENKRLTRSSRAALEWRRLYVTKKAGVVDQPSAAEVKDIYDARPSNLGTAADLK